MTLCFSVSSAIIFIRFEEKFQQAFEELLKHYHQEPKHYHQKPIEDNLQRLRRRVEAIQDNASIAIAGGTAIKLHDDMSQVTQKELLSDMIDNQLLIIDGELPYCVLCDRRKVKSMSIVCAYCGWMSNSCIHCQSGSVKNCHKCGQPQSRSFSVSGSSGICRCHYTQSFEYCKGKKCKQPLRKYETNASTCLNCMSTVFTNSDLYCAKCRQLKNNTDPCAKCKCKVTVFIERCSCNWMRKLRTVESSDSEPCVHCGCLKTKSFECCTKCTHLKASTRDSHAIPNCTLRELQKKSDWRRNRPVIYSYKRRMVKHASKVTWHIFCSHCEHANQLNASEGVAERIRYWLDDLLRNDIEIDVDDTKLLLIAAAFILYRGLMVNVDLLKELCSPGLAHPLLQTFYSLKRYCQNPDNNPPPDIYHFLLPSFNVLTDTDHKKHTLLDPYMRMIKFTHIVTTVPRSPECSFLYTAFDRFHFVLPLPQCKEELIPGMLSRYRQSKPIKQLEFCPNLSQHQSTVLKLRNGESAESFFPQLLYRLGYEGAKELEEMYLNDITMQHHFNVSLQPNCGIIEKSDKVSRVRPRNIRRKPLCEVVKFVRSQIRKGVRDVGSQTDTQPVQASSL